MSWNILPYLRRILAKPTPKALSKSYARPRGKGLDAAKSPDDRDAITRYPPWDKGIPVRAVSAVLSAQQDRIDRIFRTAGVSQSTFDQLYMPVTVFRFRGRGFYHLPVVMDGNLRVSCS